MQGYRILETVMLSVLLYLSPDNAFFFFFFFFFFCFFFFVFFFST